LVHYKVTHQTMLTYFLDELKKEMHALLKGREQFLHQLRGLKKFLIKILYRD